MMRPLPNIADITYPNAGRRTKGGAYCGKARSRPTIAVLIREAPGLEARRGRGRRDLLPHLLVGKIPHAPFAPRGACGKNAGGG